MNQKVLTELSERDEFFGRKARSPITSIKTYISYSTEKQNKVLKEIGNQTEDEIRKSTKQLVGSIENGFNLLTLNQDNLISLQEETVENINNQTLILEKNLLEINENISYLSNDLNQVNESINLSSKNIERALNWGFNATITQQKITNSLLKDITKILKIPEFEKEKQFYIENGLKFFKNAKDNKDFYKDSIENFNKAIAIESNNYFVNQILGIIYLYSLDYFSIVKAKDYFENSIKYVKPDVDSESINNNHIDGFNSIANPKNILSNSYKHLSVCYFHLEDYESAKKTIQKAIKLEPNNNEFLYDLVKYEYYLNNIENLETNISLLLERDYHYIIKIINDSDLLESDRVRKLLNNLYKQKKKECETHINEFSSVFNGNDSIISNYIELIKLHRNKDTFLNYSKALEFINTSKSLQTYVELHCGHSFTVLKSKPKFRNYYLPKLFNNELITISQVLSIEDKINIDINSKLNIITNNLNLTDNYKSNEIYELVTKLINEINLIKKENLISNCEKLSILNSFIEIQIPTNIKWKKNHLSHSNIFYSCFNLIELSKYFKELIDLTIHHNKKNIKTNSEYQTNLKILAKKNADYKTYNAELNNLEFKLKNVLSRIFQPNIKEKIGVLKNKISEINSEIEKINQILEKHNTSNIEKSFEDLTEEFMELGFYSKRLGKISEIKEQKVFETGVKTGKFSLIFKHKVIYENKIKNLLGFIMDLDYPKINSFSSQYISENETIRIIENGTDKPSIEFISGLILESKKQE